MARNLFGGSSDDYAVDSTGRPIAVRRVRFYTSAAMTTEVTDLASDAAGTGAPLTVNTDAHGFWGPVYGPDGVTTMYAGTVDSGGNPPAYVVAIYTHTSGGVASFNTRAGAVSLTKADVTATALAAADVGAPNVVVHGSTAGTARPAGATVVHWIGSVAPTNVTGNDEWTDTTSKLLKRWNGSAFDALGSAAYMSVRKARVAQFMPRLTDAMPRVAAILPTVTFPGSHAVTSVHLLNAGLTNSTVYPGVITAGPCLAYGAASMNVASNGAVSCATPAISTANPYFEWVTDAPMQELAGAISGNTLFNIECDGDLITPINLYYQAGTYIRIDWGTGNRKFRHYRLYATNGFGLQSISTAATDTIWAPSKAGVRAGFLMDSWGGNFFGIPHTVCKFMGWQYPIVDANGGTGYVAAPSSDNPKFLDRLPGLLAAGIDCLVLMGGINDPQNTAAEQTAVQTLIDTAWATDPTLPIYVFSGWTNSNSSITANAPVNLGIKQAAAARGVPFISTDGWVFGTGDTDTPTGDGNADYFIAAAHPAGDARAYLGARAGLELRARVAA